MDAQEPQLKKYREKYLPEMSEFIPPKISPQDAALPSANPSTGRYGASKPRTLKPVDTKAVLAEIRTDRAKDAAASKEARKFMEENASEIELMRQPNPKGVAYSVRSARRRALDKRKAQKNG